MRLIDADGLKKVADERNNWELPVSEFLDMIDEQPTVEAIPIATIKRAIAGISAADQCDQAGRYERELRDALNTVLKWYGSPGYQEHEKRTGHG